MPAPKNIIVYVAIACIILSVYFVVYLLWPRYWHYSYWDEPERADIIGNSPPQNMLGVYCQEPNILILNAKACPKGDEKLNYHLSGRGTSMIQVSGVGFMGSSSGTSIGYIVTDYHFRKVTPRIYFVGSDLHKEFHIKNPLAAVVEIQVDDHVFQAKRDKPLVLLIQEDGTVIEVESFEETFGMDFYEFLQTPAPLSLKTEDEQD